MTKDLYNNIFRFGLLCAFQILVLQQMSNAFSSFPYINIFVYPLFILLLPFQINRMLLSVLGFLIGIVIDIAYDSPGIHASVSLFIAYIRPFIIKRLEPKGGYTANSSPTSKRMGWSWFLRYASILMGLHLFFYFSVEAFTYAYILSILLKTVISFPLSMLFILLIMAIFSPSS
jgi:hypothetical protein